MSTDTPSLGRFRPVSSDDFSIRAKHAAWLLETPLQATQEWLARVYGCGGLHELQKDLKLRLADPDVHPAGPFDEDFERQMFEAIRARVKPLRHSDHMMPTYRGNELLHAAAALKNIPFPGGQLSRRDWKIRDIGLFCEPANHRFAFQKVKARIDVLCGVSQGADSAIGSDYAYLDTDSSGEALLSFTAHGRAVFDALQEVTGDSDHKALKELLPDLERLLDRYPKNPWVQAEYVISLCTPYWQSMWADHLAPAPGGRGYVSESVDIGFKRHAESYARNLLPHAIQAIALFEDLYGDQTKKPANHKLIGAGGKHGADSFYYPAILHFGGMVALNAGELHLAKRWLARNLRIVRDDNFGSRYPLSALNLSLGRGPASALFRYKKLHGYSDPWFDFVKMAESLRDGNLEKAKEALIHALITSPHALRAIDSKYHETDECWVGSNHNHIVHFEEFFYRSKSFWDRNPELMVQLENWVSSKELRRAYKEMHLAASAAVGLAMKPSEEAHQLEQAEISARLRFEFVAPNLMQVR